MRILVTGATGFLGGAVCRALSARGHEVVAAIRTPSAILPPGLETRIVGAIDATTQWSAAVAGIDVVMHLAGRAHVMHDTQSDPLAAFRAVNRDGTLTLARACVDAGVKRLVFVSSIKVNGEATPPGMAYTAADAPAPGDAYGRSKHEAEEGLRSLASATGLEVVIVRPPLIHGPGAKGNLASLMKAIARGLPLPLGCIINRRSLVGKANLADALSFLADHPAARGKTFLISDGEDISSPDLVRHLATAMGRPARLLPVPVVLLRLAGAMLGRRGAIDRLTGSLVVDDTPLRHLGWRPVESLDQGLRAMVGQD